MVNDKDVQHEGCKGKPRPRWRRGLRALARIAVATYVGLCVVLYFLQSRLVYHPSGDVSATPADIGLSFEQVALRAGDGVKLHGWFVPAADSRQAVLVCHGNAGNISDRLVTIATFHRMGLSVLIFDYRGFGHSEGRPSERGTYLDAEAAWGYLTGEKGFPADRIVVFGRSLGGPIAAHLAKDHTPGLLIVESTFASMARMARRLYPYLPVRLLLRFKYDTVGTMGGVHCPTLVIHSRDDDLVPFAQGQSVFAAANEPKEFLEIHGGHNDGFMLSDEQYTPALGRFIASHLPADLHATDTAPAMSRPDQSD